MSDPIDLGAARRRYLQNVIPVAEREALQESSLLPPSTSTQSDRARPGEAGVPSEIRMLRAIDIKEEKIEWLWGARIPKRYLTCINGDPGLGKSHVAIDITARVTTGQDWPDSGQPDAGSVLFISSEDGIADVLRPRLRVAGADLSRVGFLTGKYNPNDPAVELLLTLKEDLAQLERKFPTWADQLGAPVRLLVVDPLLNHLGRINPNREGEVRPLLAAVAAFLWRTTIAMIGIRHLNKSEEKALIYRAGGSIAFTGFARAEYIVGEDPGDPTRRVIARAKGNLALEPDALAYRIIGSPKDASISVLEWLGPTSTKAEQIVGPKEAGGGSQRARAKRMLLELLGEGRDVPTEEIWKKAEELQIGEKSVYAAAKELGARKHPSAFGAGWVYSLTEDLAEEES